MLRKTEGNLTELHPRCFVTSGMVRNWRCFQIHKNKLSTGNFPAHSPLRRQDTTCFSSTLLNILGTSSYAVSIHTCTMDVDGVGSPPLFHPRSGKPTIPWSGWKFSLENYMADMDGDKFFDVRQRVLLLHCVVVEAQCFQVSSPCSQTHRWNWMQTCRWLQ